MAKPCLMHGLLPTVSGPRLGTQSVVIEYLVTYIHIKIQ